MIVGGLQKSSMIDYPGKVSCVCFLTGCNFDCPFCHNPHLVRRDLTKLDAMDEGEFSNVAAYFDRLKARPAFARTMA